MLETACKLHVDLFLHIHSKQETGELGAHVHNTGEIVDFLDATT